MFFTGNLSLEQGILYKAFTGIDFENKAYMCYIFRRDLNKRIVTYMKKSYRGKRLRRLAFLIALGLIFTILYKAMDTRAEKRLLKTQLAIQEEIKGLKEQKAEALKHRLEEEKQLAMESLEPNNLAVLSNSKLTLEERIKIYLGDGIDSFGFIYYDLITGEKIAINENKVFTAASTYKLGLNMIAYDKIRSGSLSLTQGIVYDADWDYEDGDGILQYEVDTTLKKPVPINKLMELSIKYSDNIAALMLSRTLGGTRAVREKTNAMVALSCDTASNKTTPEIQFRLLKLLYENRDDEYYSHLIDLMKNTVFKDRLAEYLPEGIIAHKIGDYDRAVNDIGIVFTDRPYIIVTYSEGLDNAWEAIARISRMVYDNQQGKL